MDRNSRRQSLFLSLVCIVAIALVGCESSPPPEKPADRKNVLLITMDALRQDHLSTFGYFRPTAPTLNWLAVNGLAMRTVIVTSCTAPPSLASLHTGRQFTYSQMSDENVLRDSNATLAETFTEAGYDTAAFVASPDLARDKNFDQGFEVYEDFKVAAGEPVTADVPIKAAMSYLESRAANTPPFFLYVHLREPHPPWTQVSEWVRNPKSSESFFDSGCDYLPTADEIAFLEDHEKADLIAKYDAALRFADEQIGLLFDALRAMGKIKNTAIAVTSPYGIELLDRYSGSHAYNPFDEVLRQVVLLLDQSASFSDALAPSLQVRIFDLAPTLLGRAGIAVPASMEGVDLLTLSPDVPEFAFSHCADADVVRSQDYKLIDFDFSEARRQKRHLPVGITEGPHLFAMRADPEEKIDVKDTRAAELGQMQAALEGYRKGLGRPPVAAVAPGVVEDAAP